VICLRCPKCFNTLVVDNVDLQYCTSEGEQYGHFQQHFTAHEQKTFIHETSGVYLDTTVRTPDPDFLLECKISAIRRRFPLTFVFCTQNSRHSSTSGLFDLPSYKVYHTRRPPTSIIPTEFVVDMTIHCRVIAF